MVTSLPAQQDVPRPKILLTDDLYSNRIAMRHILAPLDVTIVEAASGNEALAACLEHEFALILMDVQMPGMDGMEVAQLLHGEDATRGTPVIFVTAGAADDMDRLKGYDVGAVDFIVKPVNSQLLSSKVRNFLQLYESRRALTRALTELDERNNQLKMEVEERKRAEAEAQRLATQDVLTGLPNRLLFIDRLATSMERADRHETLFALGYMDLDGFKAINDAHGHRAGDRVLETVARRLNEHMRGADTAARFGGDEFALILEDVTEPDRVLVRCRDLLDRISAPIVVPAGSATTEVSIGISLGIALYTAHGENADRLMHNADCALYAVKKSGKAAVRLFAPEDEAG